MRYHYTPVRTAHTKDVEQHEFSLTDGGNAKWQSRWKILGQFLTKLNILLLCNPAVALPNIYSNKLKTCAQTVLHINVYSSFSHSR